MVEVNDVAYWRIGQCSSQWRVCYYISGMFYLECIQWAARVVPQIYSSHVYHGRAGPGRAGLTKVILRLYSPNLRLLCYDEVDMVGKS